MLGLGWSVSELIDRAGAILFDKDFERHRVIKVSLPKVSPASDVAFPVWMAQKRLFVRLKMRLLAMRLSEEWIPRVAHIGPFVILPDFFFTGPESLAFDLLLVLSYLRRLP